MKAIIFDLDGVLVHTDDLHFLAWKKLADNLGIPFDRTINNRLRGVSRMDSLEIILEKSAVQYTQEQKIAFAEEKNETYKTLLAKMSPADVSDEVLQTLSTLKKQGWKLAVGSGSKNAPFILQQVGLQNFFHAVTSGNEITHGKPNPEVFLNAAAKLGEAPQNCIVVEDAQAGIEAALAGNMTAVAIGDAVKCQKAHFNLSTFADLLSVAQQLAD